MARAERCRLASRNNHYGRESESQGRQSNVPAGLSGPGPLPIEDSDFRGNLENYRSLIIGSCVTVPWLQPRRFVDQLLESPNLANAESTGRIPDIHRARMYISALHFHLCIFAIIGTECHHIVRTFAKELGLYAL